MYAQSSAFSPEIRHFDGNSYLTDNPALDEDIPPCMPDGFSHPLTSTSDLLDHIVDAFRFGEARHSLLRYSYADAQIHWLADLNVLVGYDYRMDPDGDYGFIYKGIRFNSLLNDRLRMRAQWWNGVLEGDLAAAAASPLIDGFHATLPTKIRVDNLTADITWRTPKLLLAIGRGRLPLTNNISGSLVLSDRVNDYGYLTAEGNIGDFRLTLLHASLLADSTRGNAKLADQDFPDKYLALHEVAYIPGENSEFFAGEAIIYGNRGVDINYLLPHTFWRVTEHNQWDRDNVLIYTGFKFKPAPQWTLYANAMLDEFSYGRILGSWWGNKWAAQGGIALRPQSSLLDPRLALEITAVRPWTYTHYQNHTMYSHDRRPLGYAKGSNLVDITLQGSLNLPAGFSWHANYSFTRQGSYGSDWRVNYADHFPPAIITTATAVWFQGTRTDTWEIRNVLRWNAMAHHGMYLGHSTKYASAWQTSLFGGWQFIY